MRYFCYNELVEPDSGTSVVTVSEEDIRKEYYPWWRERMIKKYGEQEFEKIWSFEECLEDLIVSNRAWEADDD